MADEPLVIRGINRVAAAGEADQRGDRTVVAQIDHHLAVAHHGEAEVEPVAARR